MSNIYLTIGLVFLADSINKQNIVCAIVYGCMALVSMIALITKEEKTKERIKVLEEKINGKKEG